MWPLIAATALVAASWLAPRALATRSTARPPPEAVARTASLGRSYAAADVSWLRTVQLMGDHTLERQRWPHLEEWIDLTTALDARFEAPYFYGALLLVSDPDRAQTADRLLQRGQTALPDTYVLPAMRGYIAYFSLLDPATAAVHYHAAARLEGAPPFLEAFAKRLEHQGHTCAEMLRDLHAIATAETADRRKALLGGKERVVLGCVEGQLKNAAAAYRTRHGTNGSLDQLRAAGLVTEEPLAPPGQCWVVLDGNPSLIACPATEPPP